jgi:chromosome segregation ATPase
MNFIVALLTSALSAGAIVGMFVYLRKKSGAGRQKERAAMLQSFQDESKKAEELSKLAPRFVSKAQYEYLVTQLGQEEGNLEREKENLKTIEAKLDTAQVTVEQKESHQQELKSSKEEDEARITEIMERYAQISSESISLEQRLATSLKNLDKMLTEVQMSADQRAAFDELSSALTNAGARLRDLLTEYQTVHERLEMLRQQHEDLEMEYTKLVEQQLGE